MDLPHGSRAIGQAPLAGGVDLLEPSPGGRFRDPPIGRDILIGLAVAAGTSVVAIIYRPALTRLDLPTLIPRKQSLTCILHESASRLWKAVVRSSCPQGGAPQAFLQYVEDVTSEEKP